MESRNGNRTSYRAVRDARLPELARGSPPHRSATRPAEPLRVPAPEWRPRRSQATTCRLEAAVRVARRVRRAPDAPGARDVLDVLDVLDDPGVPEGWEASARQGQRRRTTAWRA